MIKVVLMASGTGTNAINLINHAKKLKHIKIVGVIVDKKDSKLLSSEELDVPVFLIQKFKNLSKVDFESRLVKKIYDLQGDWVLLCGFMRVLGPTFLTSFYDKNLQQNRVINIHPSLLPKHKGMTAFRDAYDAGDSISGITLHFVNGELDAGKIFLQESFERSASDTFEEFVKKGKEIEWGLYPKFLDWLESNHGELK